MLNTSAYGTRLARTGRAPLPAGARPITMMDVMNPGDQVPDDPLIDQS